MDQTRKTLRDHVRDLLLDGKRSKHPEFLVLFNIYGEDRITKMAKEILAEDKEKEKKDG